MNLLWILLLVVAVAWTASLWMRAPRKERVGAGDGKDEDQVARRDLGANISPSQHGNEVDRWPDRTGARTRRELGARHAADVTFVGDQEEHNKGARPDSPGTNRAADLAPEDEFGEDRPAPRTTAPDQPPTQWHPKEHGVPGDHTRDGHHRSATAPTKPAKTSDPYAHAPTPGPNHIIPEGGDSLPPDVRP